MDLIHKLSITALVLLTLITAGLVIQHQISTQHLPGAANKQKVDLKKFYAELIARNAEIYAEVIDLQEQKQYAQAMETLEAIRTTQPDNPQSDIYAAQLQYSQGKIAASLNGYRTAVDSEPDYVDKKTPLFIGDKIMNLINEARGKLHREKKLKPNDKTILIALDDLYYLQRRIAGGCE